MSCSSENELVEFVDGLLLPDRARDVAEHIEGCATCRAVVAELARAAKTEVDPRAAPAAAPTEATPLDLVKAYMAKDARERELSASGLVCVLLVVGVAVQLAMHGPGRAVVILGAILVYEGVIHVAMRRGWFHPFVPFSSTCVEVSIASLIALTASPADAMEHVSTPWLVLMGGQVVFIAIRTDPRLCLLAGALAAGEAIASYLHVASELPHTSLAFTAAGAFLRASLFVACGVGGALLARHVVRRAVETLREIRDQDMLGRYLLCERLGRGGMGEVYRATYTPEGGFVRQVAVKKLRADVVSDPKFLDAFRAEAHLASTLAHPNLVQVLDCGRFRGDYVFVMEFVDGVSLSDLLRTLDRPLDACVVAYVALEVASGLVHLHEHRGADGRALELVHCDVNPPNVLVSRNGEVKLADFGVMRARTPAGEHERGFGGKLPYAAPEQLSGMPIDGRTDLFALGLTMYEALTGTRPFTQTGTALTHSIAPLPAHVAPSLGALVAELVAYEPEGRPRSARDVRLRLEQIEGSAAPMPAGRQGLVRDVADALASGAIRR